jgi:hypothetical protein
VARQGAKDLAEFCTEVETIKDVVERLTAIRDTSAADLVQPQIDGISCFSRLYCTITTNILETVEGRREKREFRDPDFLTLLDLEFARRYLAAIQKYATGAKDTPRCWAVLFDRRDDQDVGHPNFAAAGVNAHVNFDLAFALLETWKTYPPTADRRYDYDLVNDIFAEEMDDLREDFGAFLAETEEGGILDRFGNAASDLLVRVTRYLAWEAAERVWEHRGDPAEYAEAVEEERQRLDDSARFLGWLLLSARGLP